MRLLVISHTPHYKKIDGTIVGWGPTIRELNYLTQVFSNVVHIAPLHEDSPPASSLPYVQKVEFVALKPVGGNTLLHKLGVLFQAPATIKLVNQYLKGVDYFQLRTPTGMGNYLIPYLSLTEKKGWFKYAGNWVERRPHLGYAWQRFLLKRVFKNRKVTMNGNWPNLPPHCIPFENPCLTDDEVKAGKETVTIKNFGGKFQLLFVGRIEDEKGVAKILEMLRRLSEVDKEKIKSIYFVGDGDIDKYQDQVVPKITVHFTGGLSRDHLNELYRSSHILLLPSYASEGFPKVIAEAANYGCLPFVSKVSSVTHYISEENGHVFTNLDPQTMAIEFSHLIGLVEELSARASRAVKLGVEFSYVAYNQKITSVIVN